VHDDGVQRGPARFKPPEDLTRFGVLSIVAAVVTIGLKLVAWRITDSVGLLSDAAESSVNLVAAVGALIALRVAIKPPDKNHNFGHSKVEYFSAALEGAMIMVAAGVILVSAVERFLNPVELTRLGLGIGISLVAALVNGIVAWLLLRAGKRYGSITLTADGKHLMTDLWTTAAVVLGVVLVALTGWQRLDPIIAFAAGINIVITGWHLVSQSAAGLMDISLSKEDNAVIRGVLDSFTSEELLFHAVRTRESGHRRFMEMHMLVPGDWTVQRGHDAVEDVTEALVAEFSNLRVLCHLEPIEDPRSYEDIDI